MAPTTVPTPQAAPSPRIPRHVAIIMDGNGRWAKARGLERGAGHIEGVNTVRRITEAASDAGVQYLTLYAFSTENWKRPRAEVDALMELIAMALERETPALLRNNVRLQHIGDLDSLPADARRRLEGSIAATAGCTGLRLVIAISYSARWELARAARLIAAEAAAGSLDPDAVTPDTLAAHLTTASMPDPDILIRTGGDMRVSNFLLWQIAYSEIFVTPRYWPDFTRADFLDILSQYGSRERRFGLTSEQLPAQSPG